MFKSYCSLGICQSDKGARSNIDRITSDFDREIKGWKTQIEVYTVYFFLTNSMHKGPIILFVVCFFVVN